MTPKHGYTSRKDGKHHVPSFEKCKPLRSFTEKDPGRPQTHSRSPAFLRSGRIPERNPFFPRRIAIISPAMRPLRVILLIFTLALAGAPSAWAHARLVRAVPAGGAEVSSSPKQIDLWFNELLEDGFNTVTVFAVGDLTAAKRNNLAKGKPAVDGRDHTHLTIAIEALPPGDYIIEWRVLSRDGHSAPGRSTFRVR
jgi:methionine-rich copper-binding protein CopC